MKLGFWLFIACMCLLVVGMGLSSIPGTATLVNLLYTCSGVACVLAFASVMYGLMKGA